MRDALWLMLWLAFGGLWCVAAAAEIGPTFDEPFYLEQGLATWRTGSPGGLLAKGTMPLPVVVTTAPVRAYELVRGEPIDLAREMPLALALARPAALLFWAVLLVYGWLTARRYGGAWAGRIAVPLLACEPALLANAALATTDIALAACLLMFTYHYAAGRDRGWWGRVALPATLYAVALLAKASALVFGVLVIVVLEAVRAWPAAGTLRQRLGAVWSAWWARSFRKETCQIVFLGLALTFVACGGGGQPERSFHNWAHALPEGPLASAMVWLSDGLRVFPNAGVAIARQIKHNMQGHGSYLLGHTSPRALWYFFPVALAIKLTLPLLLLPLVVAVRSPRALLNPLMILAAAFLLFSLNCRVQIGTRLVLPLVVFYALGLSVALADVLARASWRPALGAALACAIMWMTFAAGSAWPHGLQYANELWGGPREAYRFVGGSDYDWGQGVAELARYAEGRPMALLYYGSDPAARGGPFHNLDPVAPVREVSAVGVAEAAEGREVAVSISLLYGPPIGEQRLRELLAFLRRQAPAGRTRCFFIYRFGAAGTARAREGEAPAEPRAITPTGPSPPSEPSPPGSAGPPPSRAIASPSRAARGGAAGTARR